MARVGLRLPAGQRRRREAVFDRRLEVLLGALGLPIRSGTSPRPAAAEALAGADPSTIWLLASVSWARLPEPEDVVRMHRLLGLDGPERLLDATRDAMPTERLAARVEVASGEVLVDVNHLAGTTLLTGIQRVTYETVRRWHRDHDVTFVRWTEDFTALTRLSDEATRGLLTRNGSGAKPRSGETLIVPWRGTYLLPEVALETARTARLQGIARWSQSTTAAIGFDTVPLTSGETTDTNVPGYFMRELAALRHVDRIVGISAAAAQEFTGWRTMLSSLGLAGPEVISVLLPVEATVPSEEDLAAAAARYTVPTVPLVLCVGSHEPRKNHLAILHAAELLWRRGLNFTLLFVGGNAWHSERFARRLAELQAAGRPVEAELKAADATLWALYRLARVTVFPSLNEGYGLPVAESLASGTPAITSNYGSMREIASEGGALLVDPRDDHDIAEAMATLLTDDLVHARLTRECAARGQRTWEDYARQTWHHMVAPGQ